MKKTFDTTIFRTPVYVTREPTGFFRVIFNSEEEEKSITYTSEDKNEAAKHRNCLQWGEHHKVFLIMWETRDDYGVVTSESSESLQEDRRPFFISPDDEDENEE